MSKQQTHIQGESNSLMRSNDLTASFITILRQFFESRVHTIVKTYLDICLLIIRRDLIYNLQNY